MRLHCVSQLLTAVKRLPDQCVDAVITSPPYAEQRKNLYGGVSESAYPQWTVDWMKEIKRVLKPEGNVAINIRPHVKNGEISDYTLRMRIALRDDGWKECDELIWIKPDSPPMGHKFRPRRSWESIHWFALTGSPYCDPKANGKQSDRIGLESKKGIGTYIDGTSKAKSGIARCQDYVAIGTSQVDKSDYNTHPAQYPEAMVSWLINLLCPVGGVVLDPFLGSGTTAVAAVNTGRIYLGTEIQEEYFKIAQKRITQAENDVLHRQNIQSFFDFSATTDYNDPQV